MAEIPFNTPIPAREQSPLAMKWKQIKYVLNNMDLKILIQKIVTIIVIQAGIYGLFIIIDPGFLYSLQLYFIFVVIGSSIAVAWLHVHQSMEEMKESEPSQKKKVLEQTDWTPEKSN